MSSSLTLYLFRHGQTEWSLTGRHTGHTDIPLTAEGKRQAESLRAAVSQIKFAGALVSPLGRARDTASIIQLNCPARVEQNLIEFDYGEYEGLTTDEIRRTSPNWTIWTGICPGGESLANVAERCRQVIASSAAIGGNVALIAHGHILRILAATWLGHPPEQGSNFMLDTCTLSLLSHEHEIPAVKIW
ncbi:MAG TPA: histidine phosphatase family protein, partial [Chroococcales cyanobacterium]